MGELVFTPLIIIAVLAISLALFSGWLIMSAGRGIGWLIGTIFTPSRTLPGQTIVGQRECRDCRQINPAAARFCRRCGKVLYGKPGNSNQGI
jgi:hypothetical protein